ncbi:uncharacterized protein [Drosophila takahashii]|uniref:uncharacterized protein n=1 Tax=Drosophila takahashii TaxID=29030 RepID=UPI0038992C7F
MYRQIRLHPNDRNYQLILWRKNPTDKIRYFRLNTVTYGTACAPYLATRCLQQLAITAPTHLQVGATAIKQNLYVDDCLSGADTLDEARKQQDQVRQLLGSANLNLRKWCANHPALLETIPKEDQEMDLDFSRFSDSTIKTLGIIWNPQEDQLQGRATTLEVGPVSKRIVCSELAKIFDPLGLLCPVTTTAKIFMQQLWQNDLDWDTILDSKDTQQWQNFRKESQTLSSLQFPRCPLTKDRHATTQLHIFTDASETAYGATAYLRSNSTRTGVESHLLCAKSRVAPLVKQTLLRLELCAAVLVAELADIVKTDLPFDMQEVYYWTDSEIVLAWITASVSSFHTFVANRVSRIHEISMPEQWVHVASEQNPADLVSRECKAPQLQQHELWFNGPTFLKKEPREWGRGIKKGIIYEGPEKRKVTANIVISAENNGWIDNINHRGSFKVLLRVTVWLLRFKHNVKNTKKTGRQDQSLQNK